MRLYNQERKVEDGLGCSLVMVQVEDSEQSVPLTPAEQDYFENLQFDGRKQEWLRGRKALKQVLATLYQDCDTTKLRFPHRQISVTHAGDFAFAIGNVASQVGIGVDFEPTRKVNPNIARWFLTTFEKWWIGSDLKSSNQLIRLWTIKEAAFKSFPNNEGMALVDFAIMNPQDDICHVAITGGTHYATVMCEKYSNGYLSIATCKEIRQ
jgi:4'-phosphopantetheinyl transferase EntD